MSDPIVDANKKVQPAMTDHAQVAEQLIEQMGNYPGVGEHFRGEWRAYYKQDIDLLMKALTQAHAAGRREGLEEAVELADTHECGSGDDFMCQRMNCASIIAGLIRAKAKEASHE